MQELRLRSADGLSLGAWYLDGPPGRPVVLLLHGNHASRSACIKQAEIAAAAKCAVLSVSLRAHGDSDGEYNDFGWSARKDVLAAVRWLAERHPDRRIVIWGQSLGSAAALFAAAEVGPNVVGYILECPYRDLPTAVRNRCEFYLPKPIDAVAFTGLRLAAPSVLPDYATISPLAASTHVPNALPVLVLAGESDRRARPAEAREIVERLGARAQLRVMPNADHLALEAADPATYRQWIREFLARFDSPPMK